MNMRTLSPSRRNLEVEATMQPVIQPVIDMTISL